MRLIKILFNQQEALTIVDILQQENIPAACEAVEGGIQVWIENEDDFARAQEIVDTYKQTPQAFSSIRPSCRATKATAY